MALRTTRVLYLPLTPTRIRVRHCLSLYSTLERENMTASHPFSVTLFLVEKDVLYGGVLNDRNLVVVNRSSTKTSSSLTQMTTIHQIRVEPNEDTDPSRRTI